MDVGLPLIFLFRLLERSLERFLVMLLARSQVIVRA